MQPAQVSVNNSSTIKLFRGSYERTKQYSLGMEIETSRRMEESLLGVCDCVNERGDLEMEYIQIQS